MFKRLHRGGKINKPAGLAAVALAAIALATCGASEERPAEPTMQDSKAVGSQKIGMAKLGVGERAGERRELRIASQIIAFRWCPPGSFTMGSPSDEEGRYDGETQNKVTLTKGFWISETEVTQGLWQEVMGFNPSSNKAGPEYPVENVSWNDCQDFIRKLNSRYSQGGFKWALPTEAQWEYACRAGTTTAYFWGNALNGDMANCDGNFPCGTDTKGQYLEHTMPVQSYEPNAWGLYDMHGNVYEWCADWSGTYPEGAVTDPKGPLTGSRRVHRGGSWSSDARYCRSARRGRLVPGYRFSHLGLRLAVVQSK